MNIKRIKLGLLFVCCSSFLQGYCQEFRFASELLSGRTANVAIAKNNVWAMQCNPAMLVYLEQSQVGASYSTNYNATDILCSRIQAGYSGKFCSYGAAVSLFGNKHFRETNYSLTIARKLNEHNSLGVTFNCLRQFKEEFSPQYFVSPEIAYFGEQERLSYGIHMINPLQFFNAQPATFKINCSYSVLENVNVAVQMDKNTDEQVEFQFGAMYKIGNLVSLAAAYSTSSNPLSINAQFSFKKLLINHETTANFYLGFSHSIFFIFTL